MKSYCSSKLFHSLLLGAALTLSAASMQADIAGTVYVNGIATDGVVVSAFDCDKPDDNPVVDQTESGGAYLLKVVEVKNVRITATYKDCTFTSDCFQPDEKPFDIYLECKEPPKKECPGTGTPGYWKNHPEAWPVDVITIGGVSYSKEKAIEIMSKPDGDKRMTLFRALVSAKLNVLVNAECKDYISCVEEVIALADEWFVLNGGDLCDPEDVVKARSDAWQKGGECLYLILDAYNNGLLCAPHRD